MKEKQVNSGDWVSALMDVSRAGGTASGICHQLDVKGENAKAAERLDKELTKIKELTKKLFQTLLFTPIRKIESGQRVTQSEYHSFQNRNVSFCQTVKSLGIFPIDDYELFSLLRYDGKNSSCYINIEEGGIGCLSDGVPPEQLNIKYLRLEQKEFFEKYLPDVLEQFQQD